jgi:hypothetical protein
VVRSLVRFLREPAHVRQYWRGVACVILTTLLAPPSLHGQQVNPQRSTTIESDIVVGSARIQGYQRSSLMSLSTTLSHERESSAFILSGLLSRYSSRSVSGYGELYGARLLAKKQAITFIWNADGGVGAYRGDVSGHYLKTGIRVGLGAYFWGEIFAGKAYDTATYNAVGGTLGLGTQKRSVKTFTSIGITRARTRPLGQVTTGVEYRPGRLSLVAQGGIVTDPDRRRFGMGQPWGQLSTTFQIQSSMAFNATWGRLPVDVQRALPRARVFSIGVRVHPSIRNRFRSHNVQVAGDQQVKVLRRSKDSARLIIYLPNASDVEVRGSFTGWQSVAMQKASNGRWIVDTLMRPGLHTIAIRIDGGAWSVPPNLPTESGDFGDEYGLLVVQ